MLLVVHDQPPEDRQPGEQAFDEALVAALDNQNRAGVRSRLQAWLRLMFGRFGEGWFPRLKPALRVSVRH